MRIGRGLGIASRKAELTSWGSWKRSCEKKLPKAARRTSEAFVEKQFQLRTVPLKRLARQLSRPSTLAMLVACRGPSLALGGHCPEAGVRSCFQSSTPRPIGDEEEVMRGQVNDFADSVNGKNQLSA